jgi:hypothetical protein
MSKKNNGYVSSLIGFAIGLTLLGLTACKSNTEIPQAELVRRTQEMFDGLVGGDKTPWKKYFAEDAMYFDEKGANMNKAALVETITPLPTGYSGTIKVVNAKSHIEGDVGVLSYDMDETEVIFGQDLTARYHATDTWMRRDGEWKIIAGQVLRYYEDPATGKVDHASYGDYAGTYELSPGNRLTISVDGDQLYRQRGEQAKGLLIPEATDIFFRKGVEGRIVFRRGGTGKVDALLDRRNNEDVIWQKIP